MIVKVTSRGITIPRKYLGGAKEAEVHEEEGRIIIVPMAKGSRPKKDSQSQDDPLYEFGSDPDDLGVTDASVNHDKYLYEEYE